MRPIVAGALLFVYGGLLSAGSASPTPPISAYEAEILIYALPVSHDVREKGFDVGWELQTSPKLPQDWYVFWVYNSKRENQGSVTIGYFMVNKYTADVCDTVTDKLLLSPEIQGIQRILRSAHGIELNAANGSRESCPSL